jgi:hypothetical protein
MWLRKIVLLGFLSFVQCSQLNLIVPIKSQTESLVNAGSSNSNINVNVFKYSQFLAEVLAFDDPYAFYTIKSHPETDLLTVTVHNFILKRFIQSYFKQLNTFPPNEKLTEECFAAYLIYVLKRNFDKVTTTTEDLSSVHWLKVIKTFNDHFAPIALNLIRLKQFSFNEILFTEITKDLDPRARISLLKQVIRICNHKNISTKAFLLMFQAFIKTCPETFLEIETFVSLHTTCSSPNRRREVFMVPIHFALTRTNDFELSGRLLNQFSLQWHCFEQEDIVPILNLLLHLTKFLSKNHILTLEEVGKRCKLVDLIVSVVFPRKPLLTILTDCTRFDEVLVFEAVLLYSSGKYTLTDEEYKITLDYIVLCSVARFSRILNTLTVSEIKIEKLLPSFDLEILILMLAFSTPPIDHMILDNVEVMRGTSPLALRVVLDIVQQLVTIIDSFPRLNLTLQVPEGESTLIYLHEPQIYQFNTDRSDLLDRFPIYIYAARIFLYRTFSIPLAATRFLDTSNESADWCEAVAFINFYIERFAHISAIENYYKVAINE